MRIAIVVLGLAASSPVAAQTVQTTRLGRPDATFPEPFSRVMGVRELPGGRLMLSDNLEKQVAILDLAAGELTRVGREGEGPGEYATPGPLYPLPGDSTLLVDMGNLRGLVIASTGEVGREISFQRGGEGLGTLFFPRAVDGQGRLYTQSSIGFRGGSPELPDSTPIVRLEPRSGRVDTVAWMSSAPQVAVRGGGPTFRAGGGSAVAMGGGRPFQPRDDWAVAADGRVAIVRAKEYRVEWLAAGRRTVGPAIPYEAVKIGKAEKEEWANQPAPTATMRVAGQGSRSITIQRPPSDEVEWPEAKPPFEGSAAVTLTGHVWIRKSQPAGVKSALYDVVDGRGQLVARVQLPEGRRLLGFGNGTLYAVNQDADDLQWLERYPLPPAVRGT